MSHKEFNKRITVEVKGHGEVERHKVSCPLQLVKLEDGQQVKVASDRSYLVNPNGSLTSSKTKRSKKERRLAKKERATNDR